jgi:endonuclease/exonuclease/phosphatase family metal-dependent hydrolase
MTFRLLTYNIMHGGGNRVAAIAEVIRGCAPDLVLLQEATNPLNVRRIAELAGMADHRSVPGNSLAFVSREKVAFVEWVRPQISRHAFIDIVPAGERIRVFGVHLSAVIAAWTEQRRLLELRAMLRKIAHQRDRPHVLAGDFNTIAPGATIDASRLPFRLRPLLWVTGSRVRWRTIQTVLDAGYVDTFRMLHPDDPGVTLPTADPILRLDYVFLPHAQGSRARKCEVVRNAIAVDASDHYPVLAEIDVS